MKKTIILSVLAAAFLSSCGTLSKYHRPESIETDNLYGSVQTADTTSMAELSWRELFTDPKLQAYIEEALHNTTMQTAEQQILALEGALKAARLAFVPSLQLGANGTLSGVVNQPGSEMSKIYSVPLTVAWSLGSPMGLINQKRGAKVQLELARDARQAAQAGVISGTVQMYYTLAMLDAQYALSQQTAANWKRTVEINRALMDAGMVNMATVAQSEATYATIQAQLLDLEHSIKTTESNFCAFLGRVPQPLDRAGLDTWQTPKSTSVGYPLQLLSRRPDIRVAEKQLAACFYSVAEAKSSFYPSINLSASLSYTNNLGTIVNPGKLIWNAIGSLTQPIFANGRLRANLIVQKASMEKARLNYQQALLDAGAEVFSAMKKLQTATEKAELYDKQIESLQNALKSTELLMDNAGYNYLQVLTAQTSLLSAQMNQLTNRYNTIQSTVALYQALGGGAE